jgi:chemotaxis protein histidine kinase CheA
MSDDFPSLDGFDINELSEEDLAILQAFEAMDSWSPGQPQCQINDQNNTLSEAQDLSLEDDDETFLIFLAEADEDISSIRQTLNQLALHESGNLTPFITLKRASHKLRGAAGTVGFSLMSTIAAQIELLAQGVSYRTISAQVGTAAITAATAVLEYCLQEVTPANQEQESISLLARLAVAYQSLHIDLQQLERIQLSINQIDARTEKHLESTLDDAQDFEHLAVCTEKLVEQHPILEDALAQVACALQELYFVQTRLQHLEPLIAKPQSEENSEKALEKKKYKEQYSSLYTLKETIADLAITTTNIQSAFTHASTLQQNYLGSITELHRDILLHIPDAHKSIHCLLVQAGGQHLFIPFDQIQHISNEQQEQIDICYSLQELLGFPAIGGYSKLLILNSENGTMDRGTLGIAVDDILGERECIVKPLASYLRRPGIAGTTIDGKGRVLLIVNLPALIRAKCYDVAPK